MDIDEVQSSALNALLSFTAENVRSCRDEVHLSLHGTRLAEAGVVRQLNAAGTAKPIPVLPAAGIFGLNASGKTAILEAIDDMRVVVSESFRRAGPGSRIFRRPFLLDDESIKRPSRFEVDLILDNVRWQYGFEVDDHHVLGEYAYYFPHGRQAKVFHRDGSHIDFGHTLRSERAALTRAMRENVLLLSVASAFGTEALANLYTWFGTSLVFASSHNRPARTLLAAKLVESENTRERLLSLLRYADLGITGIHRESLPPEEVERLRQAMRLLRGVDEDSESDEQFSVADTIALAHSTAVGEAKIPPQDESLGTQVWLGLAGMLLTVLDEGGVMLADELDASLHPRLVQNVIELFQSKRTNPHCAQLIFNSHDTNVLGDSDKRSVGRDQIWFTEKAMDGASSLYPLKDFSPRQDDSIGRRYLQGRYGALPSLNPADIERAFVATGR